MPGKIEVDIALIDPDGMAFEAHMPSGHSLVMDAGEDAGGHNLGVRPMHLLLVGLAGCTAMDVISFLRKMRQLVEAYQVVVEGERAEDHPKVYTRIRIRHIITGRVDERRLAHAIELSETKYCSAKAMLGAVAKIETEYEIRQA